jgi:hypothetical protein
MVSVAETRYCHPEYVSEGLNILIYREANSGNNTSAVIDNLSNYVYDTLLKKNVNRIIFKMKVKSTKALFLRHVVMHKKTIMLLAIFALLAQGFLSHGFINSNKVIKSNQVSHAELCCCGNVANACHDCCCSDDHAENDNTGKRTVTFTACGGTSDDIITVSKLNYFLSLTSILNYMPVTTLAETTSLHLGDVLGKPPYKPPKPQLLTNFI